jgi:predicted RNase H-like nuclease (RuvC/YqgF family)
MDSLKSKFEYNFHSEIENLKKQHLNQVEALDYENTKLKEVINSKNMEIEQILAKNMKVKNNYEDSIELLKKENEDLKDKIFETERIADIELSNLRDKLEGIKESELSLLKNAHNNQLELLNREINKLQEIIENRNAEL